MSIQEFRSRVNSIMDVIWSGGLTNHTAVIELMIYIIFLRELHVHDQEQAILDDNYKPVFSGELSIYRWDNILSLNADALFVYLGEAFEKLAEKSTNQTVKLLYNKAHIKLFAKPALRTVVHKIEELMKEVEGEEKADRSDLFGDLYEYLLSSIASAGTGGQFRTPRHIIKFMVDVIDPKAEESICDPACGTAGFLVAALEHFKQKYTSEDFKKEGRFPMDLLSEKEEKFLYNQAFTGFDSDPDMIKFGLMNLYFHKLENATVKRRNTLVDTQGETTKWDIILANPPFAGKIDRSAVTEELQMETGATEVLFLNYMIRHLTDRGRCAVIVPEGVIFQSAKAYKAIRQKLVEEAGLWAVASLPSGVFNPYAGVKTSILFFDKTKKESNSEIAFVKISNDGFELGTQRRPQPEQNDLPKVTEILRAFGRREKIESPIVSFIEKEKIAENGDYNLSCDRYLVVDDYSNAKWPIVKLAELEKNNKIEFLKGQGLSKKDIIEEGQKECIHYGEIYTQYYSPIIENVISRTNIRGKISSLKGDVLVPATTTADAMGIAVARSLNKNDVIIGGDINIIRTKNENILSDYLALLISYPPLKIELAKFAKGANILHLSNNDLRKLQIPFLPLENQKQIVDELDSYQKIIFAAKQIIQNWKPKIDIDPKWKKVKLGDIGKICMCKRVFKEQTKSRGDVPFYKIGTFGKVPDAYIDRDLFEEYKSKYSYPKKGMVLLSTSGTIGRVVVFDGESAYFQDSNIVWINNDEKMVINEYLYYVFQLTNWMTAKGGTIERLYNKIIEETLILIPPIEIQKKISKKINAERELVESNKKLIEIYEQKTKEVISKLWEE